MSATNDDYSKDDPAVKGNGQEDLNSTAEEDDPATKSNKSDGVPELDDSEPPTVKTRSSLRSKKINLNTATDSVGKSARGRGRRKVSERKQELDSESESSDKIDEPSTESHVENGETIADQIEVNGDDSVDGTDKTVSNTSESNGNRKKKSNDSQKSNESSVNNKENTHKKKKDDEIGESSETKVLDDEDDDVEEIPVVKKPVPVLDVSEDEEKATLENMIVIDECKTNTDLDKGDEEPDTEMVSEDELPEEKSIENVSDEELPSTAAQQLPETEDVSEDELTVEKKKKTLSPSPTQESKKSGEKSEKSTPSSDSKTKKSSLSRSSSGSSSSTKKRKKSESSESAKSPQKSDEPPAKKQSSDPVKSSSTSSSSKSSGSKKYVPELEKYWKAVKEDPTDFTGWTYLLQYVDVESNVDHAREAYDAFLSRYPYCYGYWRKYADFEKRKGNKEQCEEVFVRGLEAIPLSVDLWLHYLNYYKAAYPDNEDMIRSKYEKAIEACGLEFRSDRLWESYIKWETEKKKLVNVTTIYDKLLATPTQNYMVHFERFQEHVMKNVPVKILSVDDFLNLRREVLQILKQYDSPLIGAPGGDDAPPGEEETACDDSKDTKSTNEETAALRDKIISMRRKVHKNNSNAVSARWKFEEGIKRPYFHVKPLERCQLENWKAYLEFEISQGDMERIIVLFERCLIACALYEEFWLKYILFLEKQGDSYGKNLESAYKRACTIHHMKKPNLHLHWAIFEETQGNFEKAAEILSNLEKSFPSLIQIAFRRINLERRRKAYSKVCELYEHYINSSTHSKLGNNMVVKYARFCGKILQDIDKGIKILEKAIEKDKDSPRLYFQILDLCMQKNPMNVNEVVKYMDKFLSKENTDPEQKLMIAQHKVEFLEDFGTDALIIQKAHNEFLQYAKLVKEAKKKSEEMKPKTESVSTPPASAPLMSSNISSSKHSVSKTVPNSSTAPVGTPNVPVAAPYGAPNHVPPYGPTPPAPYPTGQYPNHPPPPPYNQPSFNTGYNQGDSNYNNYQNWGYSQSGYGNYNQGWTGTSGGSSGGGGGNYGGYNY